MGYGAVKYSDLKNNRMTNYKCAPDDLSGMEMSQLTVRAWRSLPVKQSAMVVYVDACGSGGRVVRILRACR
jgi:hypothetical protein